MQMSSSMALAGNMRELSFDEIEAVSGGMTNRQFAGALVAMGSGVLLDAAVTAAAAPPIAPGAATAAIAGAGAVFCGGLLYFYIEMGWVDPDEQLGASLYARLQAGMNWMAAH